MANNLLDRLLDITGLKPTNVSGSTSDDGLSGVARYLAKKAEAEAEKLAAEDSLSSVEKYLRRKAEAGQSQQAEQADETAAPEVATKPATGVAKYLASKGAAASKPKAAAAKPKKPVSRVDKYLQQKTETPKSTKSATAPQKTTSKPKPAPKAETKKAAPATTTSTRIDLSVDATQCQAGTARGGQCKRTKNLVKIQRTINKQKYTFLVCSQHHNDSFKPYKGLID